MLRTLVVLLLLANAGFFAWHQGWLDEALGPVAQQGRDPQRLKQQINPERLILLTPPQAQLEAAPGADVAASMTAQAASGAPEASSGASAGDSASGASGITTPVSTELACREAGPFTPDEFRQADALLRQRLPAGTWSAQTVAVQGLWLVYMGPYPDDETYLRKQTELRRIKGLTFEEVRSPAKLAMGLSLGRHQSEEQATAAIENLKLRGVRTAYVVNIRPTMDFSVVRVAQASADLQRQLGALPLPAGKGFAACPP